MDEYISKLNDYKKKDGNPLSLKSIETYTRNIGLLIKNHGWDWKITILTEYFKKANYTTPSQINFINAICNFLTIMNYPKDTISIYINHRIELNERRLTEPKINPKKLNNLVDWDEIIRWRDLVITKNKMLITLYDNIGIDKLQVEALLRLYTTYQRRNELADLIYGDDKDHPTPQGAENVIFHNTTEDTLFLILQDFKNKEFFGIQHLEIKGDNKDFLLKYIKINEYEPVMFRAPKSKEPLTRLNLTKLFNRSSQEFLKKTIGTTMIRKSYNNTKFKDIKKELITDSYNNAHSINTILTDYVL